MNKPVICRRHQRRDCTDNYCVDSLRAGRDEDFVEDLIEGFFEIGRRLPR